MSAIGDQQYELIRELVYRHSRINLGPDKQELVAARIGKRLRQLRLDDYTQYCELLQSTEGENELANLVDAISTNFTSFFREMKHFEFMTEVILPQWGFQSPHQGPKAFHTWSAACSSGEEPYSIAILLADYFAANPAIDWQVEASDISTRILAKAKHGVYELDRVHLPRENWLRRFFQRGVGDWHGYARIRKDLRSPVRFHHLNLIESKYPFTNDFHLIFCRNVLIYFDRPTQEQLIHRLTDQLLPGGYLFVGHSESLTGIKHTLHSIRPSIYVKPS
jgi:chemotaxis protein methyltransferase CheR